MRTIKEKIIELDLWLQPLVFILEIVFFLIIYPKFLESGKNIILLLIVSFAPIIYFAIDNLGAPKEKNAFSGKEKAMYPSVDKEMLYEEPTGIVFGKYRRKYVCRDLKEDGHVFLIGGSGSGKSSCFVINSILANPNARIFALDIKGELSLKTAKYGSEHTLIFNPQDRSQYGYNPLFDLNENSSSQKIYEVMQTIAFSLISKPADLKDPFWKDSARNLLLGLMIHYYKKGRIDFVGIIDEILSKPIRDSIDDIQKNAPKNSVEYRYMNQFFDMEDETLGGIVSEMNNHIVIFVNDQDIRFAFKDNGCKLNPQYLENGYSIYLSIREEKLSPYYDVMQLIINQTLAELEKRPEGSEEIIVIIDELPRILSAGKLERLLDGARTLRSRNCILFLITQSTEALMSAFTENEVADLIANCPYIVVLQASSRKTQNSIVDWCGKYKARKQTWNGSGNERKITISYEEKNIVEPSELIKLPKTGEAILISPYGYNRIKKVPYYKDKYLKPIAKEIYSYNESILDMREKHDE